ncbi:MAG: MFS transporter [Saprospiraceae bacterium]|nr:MFS transporter [Saprospiraceae bacterium]
MSEITKNVKKTINAWALFDWANSAYALVISTAIFPIFFLNNTDPVINIGSLSFTNSSLWTFAVSISYIIIAFITPILSGMADYSGKRLHYLKIFTILGSISCIALYFFDVVPLWLGTSAFILATIGFAGGIVFYNSYLPLIVTEDRFDRVSAKGFAAGYIGSVILLVFILWMILAPDTFNIPGSTVEEQGNNASAIGFILVGLWWIIFGFISFKNLPKDNRLFSEENLFTKGFQEIKSVYGELKDQPDLKRFLWSFFFYSAGVQTIIYVATVFADIILNFESSEMIAIVLVLQLVGIVGAYLFAFVSDKIGNKKALTIMILIWILICLIAYFCTGKTLFYFLAGLVGMVMGGIQSISRSTYSKMLNDKEDDVTSYFAFYDVLYKTSIVAGTLAYGIVDNLTGNLRYSVLSLAVFFVIGLYLLSKTNFEKAMAN